MADYFDYLNQFGKVTFDQQALSIVDAAILAQLAYCDFGARTYGRFGDLTQADAQVMIANTWQAAQNLKLLTTLAHTPRYQNVHWLAAVDEFDAQRQQQFSAVTFQLTPDTYYLSFRGTRASFVDWKEDFNLTFLDAIPSQLAASKYFNDIADYYPGNYYLGGHSKGGNLATFAFAHAGDLQSAVRAVYNLDGPGLQKPLPADPKILKLVPQSSLIGIILDPSQDFAVVHSTASGFNQHNLFSWETRARDFVYLPALDMRSRYAQKLLNQWVANLDDATKQQALDAAYQVVQNTEQETFADLAKQPVTSAKTILSGVKAADRSAWKVAAHGLAQALIDNVPKPIHNKPTK